MGRDLHRLHTIMESSSFGSPAPLQSKVGHVPWLLAACVFIFLTACIPVIPPAKTAGSTPSITTPTLTQTAAQARTANKAPTLRSPIPASTSQLPPPALATLQIVYKNQGNIQLWQSGTTTDLVEYTGYPQYMDYEGYYNTLPVLFSDDGAYIAFLQLDGGIWTVRQDGTDLKLVTNENDPVYERPYLIGWLAGTHTLLFSKICSLGTGLYAQIGTFYTANIDTGEVQKHEVFPNTSSAFFPAPDGKHIAVVSGGEIVVIEASGENLKNLPAFSKITTAIWSEDSHSLLVVVSTKNTNESLDGPIEVWRVFIDGQPAIHLSSFPAATVLDQGIEAAVWIAPDLAHLAYFRRVNDRGKIYELHVAGIDESNDQILFRGDAAQVVWAPDSQQFVVWRSSENPAFVLVDTIGNLRELTAMAAWDIAWIDAKKLLLFNGVEFWVVEDKHQEIMITRKEEGYSPLRYFRQFDLRKVE